MRRAKDPSSAGPHSTLSHWNSKTNPFWVLDITLSQGNEPFPGASWLPSTAMKLSAGDGPGGLSGGDALGPVCRNVATFPPDGPYEPPGAPEGHSLGRAGPNLHKTLFHSESRPARKQTTSPDPAACLIQAALWAPVKPIGLGEGERERGRE